PAPRGHPARHPLRPPPGAHRPWPARVRGAATRVRHVRAPRGVPFRGPRPALRVLIEPMDMEIPGIHHVTAISGDASGNVRFYTDALGLRLVKKTVTQDDVAAYPLFYGDTTGSPGTEVTFFDWPHNPPALPGAGTIAPVALRVPSRAALAWWEARFAELG